MQAVVLNVDHMSEPPEVAIRHKDQEVIFGASYYGRNSFNKGFGLFEHLNQYWESLPMEMHDQIFQQYQGIKMTFESFVSRETMFNNLKQWARQLLDIHDFEKVKQWLFFRSNINIPPVFAEKFIYDVDKQNTEEQTYLKGDYIDLITMTIIFRSLMPVWGEYISMMRQEHGTIFKEYEAFTIVEDADITQSRAYKKLMTYIDRTIANDRFNSTAIVDGISSEDFPTWVLSKTIVRRLMVSDIRGLDSKANIVTFIHKFVSQTAKADDKSGAQVKSKTPEEGEGDQENKLSAVERYRFRHDVSIGELAEIEHSISDLRRIAYRLSNNMSDELLAQSMASVEHLHGQRLGEPQITILRWVFKEVVSPRGLIYIDHHHMVRCLGVLQAVLWARGHHVLAILATAYATHEDDAFTVSGMDSKARIPKDMLEELDRLYPFQKIYGGKKTGYKTQNYTVEAIDRLITNISSKTWTATADDVFLRMALDTTSRKLVIPYNIKILVATLIIELAKQSWT